MAPYIKRLEGVQATKELRELFKAAKRSDATISSSSTTRKTDSDDVVTNEHYCYVPGRPLTVPQAASLLQNFQLLERDHFPIRVVRAVQVILKADPKKRHLSARLRTAVRGGLAFTPPPPDGETEISAESSGDDDDDDDPTATVEERQHRRRMRRLRLRREQAKYSALTRNLGSMNAVQDDGITTRSMTYAASVGLNMIVAPLSFGVFMYFFAGAVLDKFWPDGGDKHNNTTTTDIKRVIAGVVSGVLMLFVEMLLFVIRTHEMDRALRRKQRKIGSRQGPFGYYTAATSKTYKDR